MQGPIKNTDGTWLALLALGGAYVAGSLAGGAATGRVTDARGSFSDVNVPVRLGYDTLNVFQRWWWGQNDPLYAVLSRRGNSTDWVVVDATPAEIERLIEVSHQILSDKHSEAGEKRTAHATLARLTEGMGQTNGAMGPGAVGLGSRSTKRVKRIETALAKGALGNLDGDELASVQAALQSAGSLAKRKTLYAKGDRVYNASREVGGIVVDVLGRVGSSEYGSTPEPALMAQGIEVPFGTRLYEVLYDGLTYSHGPVPETDLVVEAQGSAAFDLDAAIARATRQSKQQKKTRVIGLYQTRSGKEAIRLTEHVSPRGTVSYSWRGSYGAGSGESLSTYLKMIAQAKRTRRGLQTVIEADPAKWQRPAGAARARGYKVVVDSPDERVYVTKDKKRIAKIERGGRLHGKPTLDWLPLGGFKLIARDGKVKLPKKIKAQVAEGFAGWLASAQQQKKGGETRYGMRLRPPGLGAVPKGFSSFGPHPDFRHGEIVYPQPLAGQQARHFSLTRIPAPQELTALARQIVRQMQYPTETLEMVKQDGPRGFAWFASTVGSEIQKRNIHVKDRDAFARRVLAQLRAQHS